MTWRTAFPPVAGPGARVLILGSLPGTESLRRQEYYGKPQNRFWWIMGELYGAGPLLPYAARCAALIAAGVALWDVCAAAVRPGSLDAAILRASVVPNDFNTFLAAHPGIARIAFNGQPAARLFASAVAPGLAPEAACLPRVTLPSTSPAHAGMTPAAKCAAWRAGLGIAAA